jgi:hypothetical protein
VLSVGLDGAWSALDADAVEAVSGEADAGLFGGAPHEVLYDNMRTVGGCHPRLGGRMDGASGDALTEFPRDLGHLVTLLDLWFSHLDRGVW